MKPAWSTVAAWLKRVVIAALLLAVVALVVWTLMPRPVPVELAAVTRGPLEVTVDEDGRARVQDRHVIMAPIGGSLDRIALQAGDTVVAGAVVARIAPLPAPLLDPRSRTELQGRVEAARARHQQADAAVQRAEVTARFARAELARARRLVEQGAQPRVELERRQLDDAVARRDLDSARFAAAVAASDLTTAIELAERGERRGRADEELVIRSPVAGRVLRVLVESEGVVAPGTALLEVADPTRLEIVVDVLTSEAVEIRPGAPVAVVDWGGPPLAGTVRLVEPSATTRVSALGVEEQRVAVIVDLVDEPAAWQRLGDGWRVGARITTWTGADVVQVPLGALFRDGTDWAVFVADQGRARLRRIELGPRSADAAAVVAGLGPGERVIIHPGERVTDDGRVATR